MLSWKRSTFIMRASTLLANALLASCAVSALSIGSQRPIVGSDAVAHVSESESDALESLLSLHKSLVEIPSISRDENKVGKWLAKIGRASWRERVF